MSDFNTELISQVKLFLTEEQELCNYEEKYAFMLYLFTNIESLDISLMDEGVCSEEYSELNACIDGYYCDFDNLEHNLFLVNYNNTNDDNAKLSKEECDKMYSKVINVIKSIDQNDYKKYGETSDTYDICNNINIDKKNKSIIVNVYTNYNIDMEYQKDGNEDIGELRVLFKTYDLDDLKEKFDKRDSASVELNCADRFECSLPALKISSNMDFDTYLLSMRGTWLAKLYKDDSLGLLDPNVRSYLKRTVKVNKGIFETVKTNPEQFVSYNNGITAVATGISVNEDLSYGNMVSIDKILNFQIVNGGQTTATLSECLKEGLKENLDQVLVQVKLTVLKNMTNASSLISNISVYSNMQTAIKRSDPPSNLPYYRKIKELSKLCVSNDKGKSYICYFERANGEYNTELKRNNSSVKFKNTNPKNMMFTKLDLAIAIDCWQQLPHIVSLGKEKNFEFFNDNVNNLIELPDEEYFKLAYATVIIHRYVTKKLRSKKDVSLRSNVASYTISLISYLLDKELDLMQIWEDKDLPNELKIMIDNLIYKVFDVISNPPKEHPEPRMWARKELCWEKVKKIDPGFTMEKSGKPIDFIPKNDPLMFIESESNFYDPELWLSIITWNSKKKALNKSQIGILQRARINSSQHINNTETKKLTKPQIKFIKDTFMAAVKSGFEYKNKW